MKLIARCLLLLASLMLFTAQAANPQVEFQTTMGSYVVELYPDKAPKTVANFLEYVEDGFYVGTVFHRVIDDFVVQGGGLTADMRQKRTMENIQNEAANGLKNDYGTLAMARLFEANSAAAQFFINVADNKTLNYSAPDSAHMGYCVFGRVIRGMEVVERISNLPTQVVNKMPDVPTQVVMIEKAMLLETPVMAENTIPKPAEPVPVKVTKSKSVKKGKKKSG